MLKDKACLQRGKPISGVLLAVTIAGIVLFGCGSRPQGTQPQTQATHSDSLSPTEQVAVTSLVPDVTAQPLSPTTVEIPSSTTQLGAETPGSDSTPTADGPSVYYISPSGDDKNPGTSQFSPWKTFRFAVERLDPGDTLMLMDGIYTLQDSGMIDVTCLNKSYPKNGTETAPITIMAQNERKALLKSDGSRPAVYLNACSNWVIAGLSATSADQPSPKRDHIFSIRGSTKITLYRLLGAYTNRYSDSHVFAVNSSTHVLILESEAYNFHRYGFDIFKSHHVTIRRSYGNSRDYPDLLGGFVSEHQRGDETYALYQSSDSVIENSIAEYGYRGFEIHGGVTFDGLPGGHNNQVLGSIQMNGQFGGGIDSRLVDGYLRTAANNLYKDFLVIDAVNTGFTLNSTIGTKLENVTVFNGQHSGIVASEKNAAYPLCPAITEGCSFTISNSLIFNHQTYGLRIAPGSTYTWLVEYSNIAGNGDGNYPVREDISDDLGNVQNSLSVFPTSLGLRDLPILFYIPNSSNLKGAGKGGADIGANILYRYENGTLTSTPLWDMQTGAFPCGALVPGINDLPGFSCFDFHQRLNVNATTLPVDYFSMTDRSLSGKQ